MNALIYGNSGSGKTVNSTLVEGEKNLLLCSDNSHIVLNNFERKNLTIKVIEKYEDLRKFFDQATSSKQFDNIIIDNLTDIFDMAIVDMQQSNMFKDMRQAYMLVYQTLKQLVRKSSHVNTNIIFTCWELKEDNVILPNGEIGARVKPQLPEKIFNNILGLCNVVGRVQTTEKNGVKTWYYFYKGNEQIVAKDQIFNREYGLPKNIFKGEK